MAVIADVSTVSATAASGSRSPRKWPVSSAAKCWASAALPPLPNVTSLPPRSSAPTRSAASAAMSAAQGLPGALRDGKMLVEDGGEGAGRVMHPQESTEPARTGAEITGRPHTGSEALATTDTIHDLAHIAGGSHDV